MSQTSRLKFIQSRIIVTSAQYILRAFIAVVQQICRRQLYVFVFLYIYIITGDANKMKTFVDFTIVYTWHDITRSNNYVWIKSSWVLIENVACISRSLYRWANVKMNWRNEKVANAQALVNSRCFIEQIYMNYYVYRTNNNANKL